MVHSFIGLISGGKDSIYSIYKLINEGNKLCCLANLYPKDFKGFVFLTRN